MITSECPSMHPLRNWNKFQGSNLNKSYTFDIALSCSHIREGGTWAALQKMRSCWFQKQKVDPKQCWSQNMHFQCGAMKSWNDSVASLCCWGTCIPKSHFHVGWHILSKAGEHNACLLKVNSSVWPDVSLCCNVPVFVSWNVALKPLVCKSSWIATNHKGRHTSKLTLAIPKETRFIMFKKQHPHTATNPARNNAWQKSRSNGLPIIQSTWKWSREQQEGLSVAFILVGTKIDTLSGYKQGVYV